MTTKESLAMKKDDGEGDPDALPITISNREYRISAKLVKGPKPWPDFLGLPAFLLSLTLLSPLILPSYVLMRWGPEKIRNKIAAKLVDIAMLDVDKAYKRIRHHLFRGLIKGAHVMDLGAGSGHYLKYFSAWEAGSVVEVEPNPEMKPLIQANAKQFPQLKVDVFTGTLEKLPISSQFDVVLLGNVCCELPLPLEDILKQIDSRLKTGGHIIFMEHVRKQGFMQHIQDLVNPVWRVISGGCNCNRDTLSAFKSIPGWRVYSWEVPFGAPVFMNQAICGIIEKVPLSSQVTTAVARM